VLNERGSGSQRDGDDLFEVAGFGDDAGDGVGAYRDDVVFIAFAVGVFEAGDGHPGIVTDAALAEERELKGGDEDVFGGFLGVEVASASKVEFLGEDVGLGGIGDGAEFVEERDRGERSERFAGFSETILAPATHCWRVCLSRGISGWLLW
jgi:hypothetical protein